jgi:hypothetical protein
MIRSARTTLAVVFASMWVIKNPELSAQFVQQFFHALATLAGARSAG